MPVAPSPWERDGVRPPLRDKRECAADEQQCTEEEKRPPPSLPPRGKEFRHRGYV